MSTPPSLGSLAVFVGLVVTVSLAAGAAAFAIGGSHTFDSPSALPLLLVTIWSPNLAALVVAGWQGRTAGLLRGLRLGASPAVWAAAVWPLLVALWLGGRYGIAGTLGPGDWALMVGMNLVMGPVGEELGWRGFLLPALAPRLGDVGAALAVGTLWALWHLPLWWFPSPHSTIPFAVFFATVLCFSLQMTALWRAGEGALWPCVLYHLAANVGVGWLEATGTLDAAGAYQAALPLHGLAALFAAGWLSTWTAGSGTAPRASRSRR